ncbi:Lipoxygenase y domain-containing protein 1 [Desmophyllum pertusum]|uniref:Lipoxygenase y domain-containing protein 1 n=1 Tax=Desmophyllum pertusum TaxID=174260 RepID=A0A9X0CLK0_9CNID|nr:Lipoxygenase y domain-containing protein 1 [Desmophyllum pertusum]
MLLLLLSLLLFCSASQGEDVDYSIVVKTASDDWNAGTDAQIKIRVSGTTGNIAEREIKGRFEGGSVDNIYFQGDDIGHVTGMEIHRNKDGSFPNWKLKKVTIKITGNVDSIFKYNDWVDANKWITLPLSCPSADYYVNNQGYCDVVESRTKENKEE